MSASDAVLKTKGRIFVFNELAAVKAWEELTVVDNVEFNVPINPIKVKTPSGITVLTATDALPVISCDWYNPGDMSKIAALFRGAVSTATYDGNDTVTETVRIVFNNAGDAFPLPGFNGAETAVTINWCKSADGSITYTATDDYTLAADSATGISVLTHVSDGDIPLGTEVEVNYTFTPLASKILKPVEGGELIERNILIATYPVSGDTTKYRYYYLPKATATSPILHKMLAFGVDQQTPNIMPLTFEYNRPEENTNGAQWYMIDTVNV